MRISDWSSDVCSSDLETLDIAAPGDRAGRAERISAMLALFPALAEKRGETAWRLSGGQQQMLAIARAVIVAPAVVLPDEQQLGLAPLARDQVFAIVRRLADDGAAVLLAERLEVHTSELQSLMRTSYAVFCLTKKI